MLYKQLYGLLMKNSFYQQANDVFIASASKLDQQEVLTRLADWCKTKKAAASAGDTSLSTRSVC